MLKTVQKNIEIVLRNSNKNLKMYKSTQNSLINTYVENRAKVPRNSAYNNNNNNISPS